MSKEEDAVKKLIRFLSRIRIQFRRSSSLTKTVVISTCVLSLVALLTLHLTIHSAQKRTEELAKEAAQLEQEQTDLNDKIDSIGSAEGVENIAQDEGMVGENDLIITPNTGK